VYNLHAMAPTARMVSETIGARVADAKITFDPDPQLTRLVDSWPIEFIDTAARRDWGWAEASSLATSEVRVRAP
jgi:threonine 3-dehydrogenase